LQAAFDEERKKRDAAEAELEANIANLEKQKATAEEAAKEAQVRADELSEELDAATAAITSSRSENKDLRAMADALRTEFLTAQVHCFKLNCL
jgi:chromosome segregation ATPase